MQLTIIPSLAHGHTLLILMKEKKLNQVTRHIMLTITFQSHQTRVKTGHHTRHTL